MCHSPRPEVGGASVYTSAAESAFITTFCWCFHEGIHFCPFYQLDEDEFKMRHVVFLWVSSRFLSWCRSALWDTTRVENGTHPCFVAASRRFVFLFFVPCAAASSSPDTSAVVTHRRTAIKLFAQTCRPLSWALCQTDATFPSFFILPLVLLC